MNKELPIRMCVICRGRFEKKNLHRYVLRVTEKEDIILAQGDGRGYYHCVSEKCTQLFLLLRWFSKRKRVKHESRNH